MLIPFLLVKYLYLDLLDFLLKDLSSHCYILSQDPYDFLLNEFSISEDNNY